MYPQCENKHDRCMLFPNRKCNTTVSSPRVVKYYIWKIHEPFFTGYIFNKMKWKIKCCKYKSPISCQGEEHVFSLVSWIRPPPKNCSSYSKVSGSLTLKKGNYYNIVTTGMNIYSIIPFPDLWNIHKLKTNKEEIHKWKHISRKINFKVG